MKEIIKNTKVTDSELSRWRKEGVPLHYAKHNAQVSTLMDELDDILYSRYTPDEKIEALIDIIRRGLEFRWP